MDHGLSILKLASAMTRHAGHAHAATASNIARADVPDATATRAVRFRDSLRELEQEQAPELEDTDQAISIEREMLSMAEASGQHSAATAVWRSTLNMLRLAITGPQ
ncbi:MAG: hypothetical protein AAF608_12900 [Pseudomonadota bacterium]